MVEKPIEIGIDDLLAQDAARGAALSPPLRRGLVDGDPVVGLSDGEARRACASRCRRRNTCGWKPSSIKTVAPGQRQTWYPWPYVEGLTMAEATNELAFLVTGAYGKPIAEAARRAAPPRGAVEVRLQVDQVDRALHVHRQAAEDAIGRTLQASEYGFWANVNPEVPHPRWSQATEELIGTGERRPTLLFNGYGELGRRALQGPRKTSGCGRDDFVSSNSALAALDAARSACGARNKSRAPCGARLSHVGAGRPTITFQRGTGCRHSVG